MRIFIKLLLGLIVIILGFLAFYRTDNLLASVFISLGMISLLDDIINA